MSSLIFYTEKDQALIATDTLATTPDGEPAFFTTKAFPVPHLNMVIASTGISGFLGKWFVYVNDRMVVRGIVNLDQHATKVLATLWEEFRKENSIPNELTCTVYHFGFSEEDGLIHTYAYRSANKFTSESIEYGWRVKPECQVHNELTSIDDFKQIMIEQRFIQETKLKDERVYIGGAIQIHYLTQTGCYILKQDQFDDFDTVEKRIFENYELGKKNI